ncbi:MAG: MFS transporter [Planctomycetota bacterium]
MSVRAPRSERLVVWALTLGAFAMALNAQVLAALLPFLEPAVAPDKAAKGTLASAAGLAGALGAFLLGPSVDRVGRRPPMLLGMAVFTAASVLHCFATSFGVLLAARAVAGFAVGVAYTGASAAVADVVPYERLGAAMGVFNAGIFLATPIGLPLANQLAVLGHWRWIFAVQAGLGAVTALVFARALPAGLGRSGRTTSQLVLLRQPMVLPTLAAVLLAAGGFFAFVQFVGQWLDDLAIVPRQRQAWLWVGLGLASAVGAVVLGRVTDRVGKRAFVLLSTGWLAVLLGLMTFVDSLGKLLAVGLPMTLVAAARTSAFQALAAEIVPPAMRGTLMGARSAAVQLGQGAFLILGGAVYEARGFGGFLSVSVVAVGLSYVLVRVFVRDRAGDRSE